MMAPTHRLGGIAAGTAIAALMHKKGMEAAALMAGAVLGSLIPDIDNCHSSISRKWPVISLLVSVGQAVIRGLSRLLPKKQGQYVRSMIGHRGLTHSLAALIIFPGLAVLAGHVFGLSICMDMAAGLAGGVLSHLIFDMLAGGVPVFMPFSAKRIVLARLKTGGMGEWLFRGLLVTIFIYFGLEVIPWQKLLRL